MGCLLNRGHLLDRRHLLDGGHFYVLHRGCSLKLEQLSWRVFIRQGAFICITQGVLNKQGAFIRWGHFMYYTGGVY